MCGGDGGGGGGDGGGGGGGSPRVWQSWVLTIALSCQAMVLLAILAPQLDVIIKFAWRTPRSGGSAHLCQITFEGARKLIKVMLRNTIHGDAGTRNHGLWPEIVFHHAL